MNSVLEYADLEDEIEPGGLVHIQLDLLEDDAPETRELGRHLVDPWLQAEKREVSAVVGHCRAHDVSANPCRFHGGARNDGLGRVLDGSDYGRGDSLRGSLRRVKAPEQQEQETRGQAAAM